VSPYNNRRDHAGREHFEAAPARRWPPRQVVEGSKQQARTCEAAQDSKQP